MIFSSERMRISKNIEYRYSSYHMMLPFMDAQRIINLFDDAPTNSHYLTE